MDYEQVLIECRNSVGESYIYGELYIEKMQNSNPIKDHSKY